MTSLQHSTIFCSEKQVSKALDFIPSLRAYHRDGQFHLVEDPLAVSKAAIVGMFVLRPAHDPAYTSSIDRDTPIDDIISSLYGPHDWVYNVRGLDGGGTIANGNKLDAYRLALQYGLSDAVIVGSNSVSTEGVTSDKSTGYLWQAYGPSEWGHIKSVDENLYQKIQEQRLEWQRIGYLSARKYPAQIVVTWSGVCYAGSPDFLQARIFHELHPCGQRIETYILTSAAGAARIRARSSEYQLQNRMDDMLIVLPPNPSLQLELDFTVVPKLLFDQYGMRIVNHDGGHRVLLEFSRAGALSQLNLTLGRKTSVIAAIGADSRLDSDDRSSILESFNSRVQYFFRSHGPGNTGAVSHSIPRELPVACLLVDDVHEAVVATFDTSRGFDFYVS